MKLNATKAPINKPKDTASITQK